MKYINLILEFILINIALVFNDANILSNKYKKDKFELPKEWNVPEKLKYLESRDENNRFEENYNIGSEHNGKNSEPLLDGIFSKAKEKYGIYNEFEQLENIREDLMNNWCFNMKYGSKKVIEETDFRILLYFVKKNDKTKDIKDCEYDEFKIPPRTYQDCWGTYLKLVNKYNYEFYGREFEMDAKKNLKAVKVANGDTIDKISNKFEYNREMFEKMGLKNIIKVVEPINIDDYSEYYTDITESNIVEKDSNSLINRYQEKQKFSLRYTCELYMNTRKKVDEITEKAFEDYNFKELQIENHVYRTWKKLYLRSPSHSLWYIFKKLIPIRGDLTIFNLSNGDLPLLPEVEKLSIPAEPPDFFEFTTIPRSCSNNLVALSLNFGYRIQLGIPKTPKYIHFGKLYRYFENSMTTSHTSLNLCKRAIKLLTMFQAYYYKSIDEYKPDPNSYFYWQTPNWDSFSGYVSYLPVDSKVIYPSRNQFVWCLLWSSTEYARTFSRFRINPIKITVVDVSHIPMKMQNVGIKPNLESCFILIRYLWMAKLLRINKRKYRPLKKDSEQNVIIDYSSIYYICIVILKCRTTYHRAYLKNFHPESIDPKIEEIYDTQNPYSVYNNMNKRFIILNLPKLNSLKKIKTVLYGVVSTVLFGAMTGILLLNILTNNNNNNLIKINHNNPMKELSLL